MSALLKVLLVNLLKTRIKKAMFRKFAKEGGIVAVVVGLVSYVSGVDIAPADVDKVISGIAVVAIYGPQIYDGVKARFTKGSK